MPTILLSCPPTAPAIDLRSIAAEAGFSIQEHALASFPRVEFGPIVAAVVEVTDRADAAATQTRRWRAELGDQLVPVIWVVSAGGAALTARGLDAGADVCLARPVEPTAFVAQLRAAARTHAVAARVATRAAEARLIGDQLQKAYARLDREQAMARQVFRTFLPRALPEVGMARFAVCHRPRSKVGSDFYDVRALDADHVGFVLGDALGHGATVGSLLGMFVTRTAKLDDGGRVVPPDAVLSQTNRELLGLGLDDAPLVALVAGTLNVRTGTVAVARAGLPPPVFVPATGEPQVWAVPGPFLGTTDTTYLPRHGRLAPGDTLLLGTDGTLPDGTATTADPLREAAARHRDLSGQAFVDAVARELLPRVNHPDDFTLLAVEMTG